MAITLNFNIMKAHFLSFVAIMSLFSYSQDGSLDVSFGNNGIVITDFDDSQDFAWAVVAQADQKLVVSGIMSLNSNDFHPYLVRYMPDGSIDNVFGIDGKVIANYGSAFGNHKYLFVDNQQNIIAAGDMDYDSNFVIAKYRENGDLNNDFGDSGVLIIPNGNFSAMTLLEDGSILLFKFTGSSEITIIHYLGNGILDTAFGTNGYASSNFTGDSFTGRELKIDKEDNIYFVGSRDNASNADIILMKFRPDGYLDTNFGDDGKVSKNIDAMNPMNFSSASIDFTNDNKIVIAGSCGACVDLFEPVLRPYFLRYLNDGLPDPSFGDNGTVLLPISGFRISQIMIQENERMLVSGDHLDCFEGSFYMLRRYFPGGAEDNSFNNGASMEFDYSKSILQEDGKIVSVGNTFWYNGSEDIVLLRHNNTTMSVDEFQTQVMTVYPNPSNGVFTIRYNFLAEDRMYQITDVMGKIILSGRLLEINSTIDLSAAQSGIYFLKTQVGTLRLAKN